MKKQVRFLLLMAAFLMPWVAQAQGVASGITFRTGVDTTKWIPLTSAAQAPAISSGAADDGATAVQNIGFSFVYGEETVSQFSLSTNGRVKLGPVAAATSATKVFSSTTASWYPTIVGYNCDTRVNQDATCYAKYELVGTAPNRILVIEYKQPNTFSPSNTARLNYQIQLHEDSSKVVIVYGATTATSYSPYHAGIGFAPNDIFAISTTAHTGSVVAAPYNTYNSAYAGANRYYEMVLPVATCFRPTIASILTTPDSASFAWSGTASSFTLEYADSAFTPGANQATVITTSDLGYALDGLAANTEYHYALRSECGAGDVSSFVTGTFKTRCSPSEIPYVFGFEDGDTLATCWYYGRGGTNPSATYPNPANTTTPHSGAKNLACYVSSNTLYWAALPSFTATLSDLMLLFYVRNANVSSDRRVPMQVGYMTDVSDPATFVPLYTSNPNVSTFVKEVVSFPDSIAYPYNATIAFMFNGTGYSTANNFYVDDIELVERPTCPFVQNIVATASVNSAILTWDYNANSGINAPVQYEISYVATTDTTATPEVLTSTDRMYSLTELTPGTEYKVWIAASCSDGSMGNADSVVFTTGTLSCAQLDTANSTLVTIGSGTSTTTSFPFTNNYYYSYSQMLYKAEEIGGARTITSLFLQRPTTAPASLGQLETLEIYMAHTNLTTLENGYEPYSSGNFRLVKSDITNIHINTATGWVEYELETPFSYNGTSNLIVAFNSGRSDWHGQTSYNTYYTTSTAGGARRSYSDDNSYDGTSISGGFSSADRPNIRLYSAACLEYGECAAPLVVVDSVSDTAAYITWMAGYQETEWDVFYRCQGDTVWTVVATGVTDHAFVVGGLQGGRTYEIGVMGICDDSLMTVKRVTTACGPIYHLPFTEDFATVTTSMPNCWTHMADNGVGIYDSELNIWGDITTTRVVVLPAMHMSVATLEMLLDMRKNSATNSGLLVVGVMTDPTDLSTFEPVDTLQTNAVGNYETKEVDFSTYTGTGQYIAFRNAGYTFDVEDDSDDVYITNVQVMLRSACRPLTRAYATNISFDRADIVIQDLNNLDVNDYIVYYGTKNNRALADSMLFHGDTASITGLLADTTYYVWVGAQCGDGNSRLRSLSFTTTPPCVVVNDLAVHTSAANSTAVISWLPPTEAYPADRYVVSYKSYNDATWTEDTTQNTYYYITGLLPNTNYQYNVRTLCGDYASVDNYREFVMVDSCAYIGTAEVVQKYTPTYGLYNHSYTQNIYLANEMAGMGDTLYGIFYNHVEYQNTIQPHTYTIEVYLGHTDDTAFATTSSWVPASALTQVATSYALHIDGPGTYFIPFSTPFVRDATRNMVVAIDNNTGEYFTNHGYWLSTETTGYRSLISYNDNTNLSVTSPGTARLRGNFVPDVLFSTTCSAAGSSACAAPIVINTAKTSTSLDIRWFAGGSETTWTMEYRAEGDSTWITHLPNTTLTATTLTGLSSGLLYEVRVSHICNGDTLGTTAMFSTECSGISLPYVENFNAAADGTYDRACWQTGAENDVLPTVGNYVSYGKMVEVVDGAYLVAPSFQVPINQLQVNVTYWVPVAGDFLYVGVILDPSNLQTFVPIDTLTAYNETSLANATVHFNNYPDSVGNICFYMPAGYPLYGSFFLKNLIFDVHHDCPTVDSIWTATANTTDVTIAWNTDNVGSASSYLVEYGIAGFTPGTGTTISATGETATFNGLVPSTVYEAYITPICGTDAMYRSSAYRFQTECGPVAIPYSMNFDLSYLPATTNTHTLPPCWYYDMVYTGNTTTSYHPQILWSDNYATSGRNVLRMYCNVVLALPEMASPLDTLQLSFYALSTSSHGLQVGVVDSLTPGFAASFVPLHTIEDCNNDGQGVRDTVYFCGYTTGQYIAFKNIGSTTSSIIYLDDIVIDYRPACVPVSNVHLNNVSATTADVQWNVCGTPQGFEVEYGEAGFAPGTGTTLTTTTNNVALTGLTAATEYDVYVRVMCGANEYSDYSEVFSFATACQPISSGLFAEDFESTDGTTYNTAGVLPICWTSYTNGINANFMPHVVASGSYWYSVAGNSLVMTSGTSTYGDTKIVRLPRFAAPINTLTLSYWMATESSSAGTFSVGYLTGENMATDFVAIKDIPASSSTSNRNGGLYDTIVLDTLPATAQYIAFKWYHNNSFYSVCIDNVQVMGSGAFCNAPTVTVAPSFNEATLSWNSEATNFEVSVKAVADAAWPAETAVNNAYSYTATGLTPATEYMYRVRALCDDGLTSGWAEGRFTTDSLPCFTPTNLVATPALGSVELNWTAGGEETEWIIHVWNSTFDETYDVTNKPYTVTGLTSGTEYQAAVAAVCGGGALTSDYSDIITFTTDVCDPVTNVSALAEGQHVTVSWTAGANNDGRFLIEYGFEGFAAGTGTTVEATTNSVTITGLESETIYEVYVRAVCEGQHNSVWSDAATFETSIGINTVEGNNLVDIYPNPADNTTTISVSGVEGTVSVTIVDMNGRTVSTYTMECTGDCEKMLNVDNLAAGSYFVRLQGNGLNAVKKLVIK